MASMCAGRVSHLSNAETIFVSFPSVRRQVVKGVVTVRRLRQRVQLSR